MSPRPAIPKPMKRAIRKRCGFGCIICGKPICQYHHINGYKDEIGHIEEEITLLCESCHRKEQNGLITRDNIVEYDADPKNWRNGRSEPDQVWYVRDSATKVTLGNNSFNAVPLGGTTFTALMLDGVPIIQLEEEDGVWLLTLRLSDWNHHQYLYIERNELVYSVSGDVDIEWVGGRLTLRAGQQIAFLASFKAPELRIERGFFFWNGIIVSVDAKGLLVFNSGSLVSNQVSHYCPVGISVGRNPIGQAAAISMQATKRLVMRGGLQPDEVPESDVPLIHVE